MPYSKITSIILYVVAAISLVVMLFFYVSPRTVDIDELEARVTALTTGGDMMSMQMDDLAPAETDSTVADTTAAAEDMAMESAETDAEADSAAMAPVMEEPVPEPMPEEEAGEIDLKDHLSGWELMVYKRTDYALGWAYILFIIAAIAALVFPMINIATDVKALIRIVSVLGGAAVLILLSYFVLASDETIEILGYTGTENSNPTTLKWVGTSLFSTYFLFGLAIISILYSEVVKLFK